WAVRRGVRMARVVRAGRGTFWLIVARPVEGRCRCRRGTSYSSGDGITAPAGRWRVTGGLVMRYRGTRWSRTRLIARDALEGVGPKSSPGLQGSSLLYSHISCPDD